MMESSRSNFSSLRPPPAEVGMKVEDVDTPALLLDLDAFERNLVAIQRASVRVRPHAKAHKCPEIARRQMAHGAVGICCQKVSEAEVFVREGMADVLITNEIVGAQKLSRLANLALRARVGVCVDDLENVRALGQAAAKVGSSLDVYVEVNVGGNRCGVDSADQAVVLAAEIARTRTLRFAGIQAYHGPAQHQRTPELRAGMIASAIGRLEEVLQALKQAGLRAGIVTGGGTGTHPLEAGSHVYNEIQPGSYVFMDADYARNLEPVPTFSHSLFILTTIMSHASAQRAVVDAGLKAHSVDSGMPAVHGLKGITYVKAADEHGLLQLEAAEVKLGQKIRLIPGHCDPTVNLYDWLVCYRGDQVETCWPIAARGAFH